MTDLEVIFRLSWPIRPPKNMESGFATILNQISKSPLLLCELPQSEVKVLGQEVKCSGTGCEACSTEPQMEILCFPLLRWFCQARLMKNYQVWLSLVAKICWTQYFESLWVSSRSHVLILNHQAQKHYFICNWAVVSRHAPRAMILYDILKATSFQMHKLIDSQDFGFGREVLVHNVRHVAPSSCVQISVRSMPRLLFHSKCQYFSDSRIHRARLVSSAKLYAVPGPLLGPATYIFRGGWRSRWIQGFYPREAKDRGLFTALVVFNNVPQYVIVLWGGSFSS